MKISLHLPLGRAEGFSNFSLRPPWEKALADGEGFFVGKRRELVEKIVTERGEQGYVWGMKAEKVLEFLRAGSITLEQALEYLAKGGYEPLIQTFQNGWRAEMWNNGYNVGTNWSENSPRAALIKALEKI